MVTYGSHPSGIRISVHTPDKSFKPGEAPAECEGNLNSIEEEISGSISCPSKINRGYSI